MKPPTGSGGSDSSDPPAPVGHGTHSKSANAGRWMIVGAATMWGATATVARLVFRDHAVPAFTVVELRLLIACVLMLAWLTWRNPKALRVDRADWPYLLVLGLFGVAAIQGTYYYSISRLGVGPSILLQYLAPALIVLYEMIRGRPPRPRMLLALVAALAGTGLLVMGMRHSALNPRPLDWVVGFSSAVTFAFYVSFSKPGLARYSPLTVLLYTFSIAAVFWSFVTPPWRILAAGYGPSTWGLFLVIGVFSTLLPFALFYAGLARLRPAEAGILATSEPVVAIALAAVFLGEGLRPVQWLGGALVIAATLLASAREAPGAITAERV